MEGASTLPTIGWVEEGNFNRFKSFMDVSVRSLVDDFTPIEHKRFKNLKCLVPSGSVVPGLVLIVKEVDVNWDAH